MSNSAELVHVPQEFHLQVIEDDSEDLVKTVEEEFEKENDLENEVSEVEFKEVKTRKQKKQIVIDNDHWFSETELKELSRQIVALDAEIDNDENEMESLKSQLKELRDGIENKDSERRKLSRKYSQGYESRSIACVRIIDFDDRTINYYDVNTNELVKTEDLQEGGLFDKEESQEWN